MNKFSFNTQNPEDQKITMLEQLEWLNNLAETKHIYLHFAHTGEYFLKELKVENRTASLPINIRQSTENDESI